MNPALQSPPPASRQVSAPASSEEGRGAVSRAPPGVPFILPGSAGKDPCSLQNKNRVRPRVCGSLGPVPQPEEGGADRLSPAEEAQTSRHFASFWRNTSREPPAPARPLWHVTPGKRLNPLTADWGGCQYSARCLGRTHAHKVSVPTSVPLGPLARPPPVALGLTAFLM